MQQAKNRTCAVVRCSVCGCGRIIDAAAGMDPGRLVPSMARSKRTRRGCSPVLRA